jgi:serine/threonine protein kinase
MSWLSDQAVERLRAAARLPDLGETPYRLLEPAGRGGMGTVYLAEDTRLQRRVALKVLDLADPSAELAARLLREARILAQLEHPGIVPVHDVGTLADGRVFYTMKFVQGKRLDQHLAAIPALRDRLRIFQSICDAVAFAHARGVLHRDLKPENIMVGPFGEVLVMDWGVAKVLRNRADGGAPVPATGETADAAPPASPTAPTTAHGAVLGTPGYMAPEQARGEVERLDQRADVFSLGALLRFLLTGRAPPDATTTTLAGAGERPPARLSRRGGMPRALAAVCAKAMAPEPDGRYATAQELAAEVARFMDGEPVAAYPEGIFGKAARLYRRYQIAVLLVLAYLLMRIFFIFWARR